MPDLKTYPIQPLFIAVRELHAVTHRPHIGTLEGIEKKVQIETGVANYKPEEKTIQISVGIEIGSKDPKGEVPFYLYVQIVGEFQVDDQRFPVHRISEWAEKNAPMILWPYVREQVYSLSARCNVGPIFLPLVEVPVFTMGSPVQTKLDLPEKAFQFPEK
jgi:preprotein translocase subunit SecB